MKLYLTGTVPRGLQTELRDANYNVFYTGDIIDWSNIDPAWEKWTVKQFQTNLMRANQRFNYFFQAMEEANACVLVTPATPSALITAGWFSATENKALFIYAPGQKIEAELFYTLADGIFRSSRQLLAGLDNWRSWLEEETYYD